MRFFRVQQRGRYVERSPGNSNSKRLRSLRCGSGPGFYSAMNPQMNAIDYNQRPFIAIWEVRPSSSVKTATTLRVLQGA